MTLYGIEPFGEVRADLRNAMLASLIYNANRGRGSKNLGLQDFMLFQEKTDKPITPDDQKKMVKDTKEKLRMLSKLAKRQA